MARLVPLVVGADAFRAAHTCRSRSIWVKKEKQEGHLRHKPSDDKAQQREAMAKGNIIRGDLNQNQAAVVANPTRGGGKAGQRPGVLRQAAVAGVGVIATLTLAGTLPIA